MTLDIILNVSNLISSNPDPLTNLHLPVTKDDGVLDQW